MWKATLFFGERSPFLSSDLHVDKMTTSRTDRYFSPAGIFANDPLDRILDVKRIKGERALFPSSIFCSLDPACLWICSCRHRLAFFYASFGATGKMGISETNQSIHRSTLPLSGRKDTTTKYRSLWGSISRIVPVFLSPSL